MLRAVLSRIFGTFHRRQLDDEFDEEVREHLNMLVERLIARGMDPAEAFYAARRIRQDSGPTCGVIQLHLFVSKTPRLFPPGTKLGPYEIVAPIGAGGMG